MWTYFLLPLPVPHLNTRGRSAAPRRASRCLQPRPDRVGVDLRGDRGAGDGAAVGAGAGVALVLGDDGRAVLARYGFSFPDGE